MSEKLRGLRHFSIPFVILVCGIAVAAYFVVSRPSAHPNATSEKVWPVRVVVAELRDFRPRIRAFGEIRAGREAEIRAMVSGRLIRLHPEFRDGAVLSAGTELAVIDPVDYEITVAEKRAELDQARAVLAEYRSELVSERKLLENARRQVEIADRNLSRATDLASTGRESQRARDDAELAVASTEQSLLQREQTIARLQTRTAQQNAVIQRAQAALDRAARDLSHTAVLAPFDGFVADVRLALGKRVAVGESLGRLLAADQAEVRFELPEAHFARLVSQSGTPSSATLGGLIGGEVEVEWRLGDGVPTQTAVIDRIGAEIDAAMGGIVLFARLRDGANIAGLRAGAFVEVRIPDVEYRSVYVLPAKTIADDGRGYVLDGDRLKEVKFIVLRDLGEEVIVTAELGVGAKVVTDQFAGIGPGLRAREL